MYCCYNKIYSFLIASFLLSCISRQNNVRNVICLEDIWYNTLALVFSLCIARGDEGLVVVFGDRKLKV